MNRIKVWVFTLLVVIAAGVGLLRHSIVLRAGATSGLDALLAGAVAQVGASVRNIAREASAAAAFTARDEKLVAALNAKETPAMRARRAKAAPEDPDAEEAALGDAARAALTTVERTFGFELPGTTVVTAGNREWLARKGPPSVAEGEGLAFLRAAIDGKVRRGFVRLSQKLWYAAASPAGAGAGLMVLVPLDERWAKDLAAASGVDVTLSVPEVKPVSTAAEAIDGAAAAALPPNAPGDLGRFGKAAVAVGPLKLPPLPLLSGTAPAARARAFALDGMKKGFVIASAPAGTALAALVRLEWIALAALALTLVVGVVLGFTVRAAEAPPALPPALVAAAVRIEKGDFSARVPAFAGRLGTVAAALNKAAELAGPAAAGGRTLADEVRAPAAAPALGGGPFEAAPARAPDLLRGAAAAAPSPADEDAHWQEIYQEFLRTRAQCGEASEGLTYEKFKVKLEGNKAQLISKYACRSVRFQVYVKDGKAALKATPVK